MPEKPKRHSRARTFLASSSAISVIGAVGAVVMYGTKARDVDLEDRNPGNNNGIRIFQRLEGDNLRLYAQAPKGSNNGDVINELAENFNASALSLPERINLANEVSGFSGSYPIDSLISLSPHLINGVLSHASFEPQQTQPQVAVPSVLPKETYLQDKLPDLLPGAAVVLSLGLLVGSITALYLRPFLKRRNQKQRPANPSSNIAPEVTAVPTENNNHTELPIEKVQRGRIGAFEHPHVPGKTVLFQPFGGEMESPAAKDILILDAKMVLIENGLDLPTAKQIIGPLQEAVNNSVGKVTLGVIRDPNNKKDVGFVLFDNKLPMPGQKTPEITVIPFAQQPTTP